MDTFLDNLRTMDRQSFFYLNDFAIHNVLWQKVFHFFAEYGIILVVGSLIYLLFRNRINALFAAMMAMIISTIVAFLIYLIWQRPRPFITYAEASKLATHTSINSFPSGHTFLSFAIATTVLLYGHKKLGILLFLISIIIAVSRVATGVHYPSDVIGGAIIGIISGMIASWVVESFEKFWEENSAGN